MNLDLVNRVDPKHSLSPLPTICGNPSNLTILLQYIWVDSILFFKSNKTSISARTSLTTVVTLTRTELACPPLHALDMTEGKARKVGYMVLLFIGTDYSRILYT